MTGRYVPPSLRAMQAEEEHPEGSAKDAVSKGDDLPARSLEQLSLDTSNAQSPRDTRQRSFDDRGRGRGRGPRENFRGRGRGRGQGRGRDQGSWNPFDNRYNNPHHQRRGDGSSTYGPQDDEFLYEEIHQHYWPSDDPSPAGKHSTLNDSAECKDELVYLMLFRDANPRWESEQIVYAHTSIEILPGYSIAYSDSSIFEVHDAEKGAPNEANTHKDDRDSATANTTDMTGGEPNICDQDAVKEEKIDLAGFVKETFHTTSSVAGDGTLHPLNTPEQTLKDNKEEGQKQETLSSTPKQHTARTGEVNPETNIAPKPPARPIAVFTQSSSAPPHNRHNTLFQFSGYYRLADTTFLHPRTRALEEMMLQKWDLKDSFGRTRQVRRDRGKWAASLSQRWAICRFVRIESGQNDLQEGTALEMPKIERLKRETKKKKEKKKTEKEEPDSATHDTDHARQAVAVAVVIEEEEGGKETANGSSKWRGWAKAESQGHHRDIPQ